jgi:hypothetical protein
MPRKITATQVGAREGFRSGLEGVNAAHLKAHGHSVEYETLKLKYTKPARSATYTPDFPLWNAIIIETKGRFVTADRQKHILIKQQYPDLEIRFVFSNPNTRISKTSKTTYAVWCETNGFQYASKLIPKEWLDEVPTPGRMEAAKVALGWQPPVNK